MRLNDDLFYPDCSSVYPHRKSSLGSPSLYTERGLGGEVLEVFTNSNQFLFYLAIMQQGLSGV
jgi:hypothetical protein